MALDRNDIRYAPIFVSHHLRPEANDFLQNIPQELLVKGQGIVAVSLKEPGAFKITVKTDMVDSTAHSFSLDVSETAAAFWQENGTTRIKLLAVDGIGIDPDPLCVYWLSIDCHNRRLRYGKGEMRKNTVLAEYSYPPALPNSPEPDPYAWVSSLEHIVFEGPILKNDVWRDPVTIDPALVVVPINAMTMDMAANYRATVPGNLTVECQKLYDNIVGSSFTLDTPDFPDFTNAIEQSIRNSDGWCYKKLQEKADEFGTHDEQATYLRITLGENQGDSPGIPYVMEIWPAGHYSPIHNHAGANAIIRVMHGEITSKLFSMLSIAHQKPFAQKTLPKEAVTWITPSLNQTHQLHNTNQNSVPCITIQCYLYNIDNNTHYEYFDYITNDGQHIEQFMPNSDMGFVAFKELMRKEWLGNIQS